MTAGYPSEEPIAGKPHDGICGGESQQWLSYPTFVQNLTPGRLAAHVVLSRQDLFIVEEFG
jgi:hypothetical protein